MADVRPHDAKTRDEWLEDWSATVLARHEATRVELGRLRVENIRLWAEIKRLKAA